MPDPSRYQAAVLDHVAAQVDATPAQNAIVSAVPGGGKTTLLTMAAAHLGAECRRRRRGSVSIDVVAFGNRVAKEIGQRLRQMGAQNAEARTLHSAGLRAWREMIGGMSDGLVTGKDAQDKARRLIRWLIDEKRQIDHRRAYPSKVAALMNAARNVGLVPEGTPGMSGLVPDTFDTWVELMDYHGVETDYPRDLAEAARLALRTSISWAGKIADFPDMLYMPTLTDGATFPRRDFVFVDELQDLDPLQRRMALLMCRDSVFLGVGDRRQAIFGWRGAAVDSMDRVAAELRCIELPLSVCYRCPTSHIELARQYAPQIEARPGAPVGLVEMPDKVAARDFLPGDVVICRQKAPGAALALWLIRHGVPARILGRDIGFSLTSYVDGFKARGIEHLLDLVDRRTGAAISRAKIRHDDETIREAIDRQNTIHAIAESCLTDDVAELKAKIVALFDDEISDRFVTIATIHKFKGGEADRVWWLDPELCDESKAYRHEWQRQEVRNLRFVALTRSRSELRMFSSTALV